MSADADRLRGKGPRREWVYRAAVRAQKLSDEQAAKAWRMFAVDLEQLGERDVPKFWDLLVAFRDATRRSL